MPASTPPPVAITVRVCPTQGRPATMTEQLRQQQLHQQQRGRLQQPGSLFLCSSSSARQWRRCRASSSPLSRPRMLPQRLPQLRRRQLEPPPPPWPRLHTIISWGLPSLLPRRIRHMSARLRFSEAHQHKGQQQQPSQRRSSWTMRICCVPGWPRHWPTSHLPAATLTKPLLPLFPLIVPKHALPVCLVARDGGAKWRRGVEACCGTFLLSRTAATP